MSTNTLTEGQKLDLLNDRVEEWLTALRADYLARGEYDFGNDFVRDVPGPKFQRIVMHRDGTARSVHAFIDRDGNVYKAEGWKKPAKGVRYNLLDDASFHDMLARLDWAGSYLYKSVTR